MTLSLKVVSQSCHGTRVLQDLGSFDHKAGFNPNVNNHAHEDFVIFVGTYPSTDEKHERGSKLS